MESNRRHNPLVDKQFQGHFITIGILLAVILVNLAIAAVYLFGPPSIGRELTTTHALVIGVVELILMLVAYQIGAHTSNRIAGPVYVMARSVERLADGDLGFQVRLRRNDYFKAFGAEINVSIERLRGRVSEMKETMDALSATLPNDGEARALADRLHRQLAEFRTEVGSDEKVKGDDNAE